MKKRFLALICVAVLLLAVQVPALAASYGSYSNVMNSVARVCVDVDVYVMGMKIGSTYGTGSAFAVGERNKPVMYFVTNRHVIEDWENELVNIDGDIVEASFVTTGYYLIFDNNSIKYPVSVVTDNAGGADLAVLKMRETTDMREPAVLRPYDDPLKLAGSSVWSAGYPAAQAEYINTESGNADDLMSGKDKISFGNGVFSAEIDASISSVGGSIITTNATINSGNSGGPLVDEKGAVVGVCTYSLAYDYAQGINGAVSVNEVVKLLDRNSIPYMTVKNASSPWYIYAIFGVAIAAVIALIVVVLMKKKKEAAGKAAPAEMPAPVQGNPPKPAPLEETRTLIGVSGALANKKYTLKKNGKLIIGRDPKKCNIVIPYGSDGVSGVHCIISFDGRTASITDNSRYGTYVDKKKMAEHSTIRLHRGLPIDLGSEKNRFTLQ